MLKVSVGDKLAVNIFRLPRDSFAVTVLSAQLSFVTKKNIKEAAPVELDAAILNAHIQSRFGGQVCLLSASWTSLWQVTHHAIACETHMTGTITCSLCRTGYLKILACKQLASSLLVAA